MSKFSRRRSYNRHLPTRRCSKESIADEPLREDEETVQSMLDDDVDSIDFSNKNIQGVKKPLRPPLQFHASMISQMYFTSFDRARRALQNCMHQKRLSHLFEVKNSRKKNTRFFNQISSFHYFSHHKRFEVYSLDAVFHAASSEYISKRLW
jgi:hypothetical protein